MQIISVLLGLPRRIAGRVRHDFLRLQHHFMMKKLKLRGIIHVGGNMAQERDDYKRYGLNVLWIEPIPEMFNQLNLLIAPYSRQRALQYLVLDEDEKISTLHVSNNDGASSSVLSLAQHRDVWPTVRFTRDIEMLAYKLDTILAKEEIDLSNYDGLVLDTQGSELLIIKGADHVLKAMKMVIVEVADFESYLGCPRPEHIAESLKKYNLREFRRVPFATHAQGGHYYNIIYLRQ